MRVFGKRGGAPRRTPEGRGWTNYPSSNDVIVDLPTAAYSPRSFDLSMSAPVPDMHHAQMAPVSTGALALIEQLARELHGARVTAPAPVPAPVPAARDNSDLLSLVSELRGEIKSLKAERDQERMPPLQVRAEDREVFGLLAELRSDISALKKEQKRVFKREEDREVHNLLAELRRDIRALKDEQVKAERREEDREVHNMLAALKSDIEALKKEQSTHDVKRNEDREVHNLLAALKSDIEALKQEQKTLEPKHSDEGSSAGSDVQQLLASLKDELSVIKKGVGKAERPEESLTPERTPADACGEAARAALEAPAAPAAPVAPAAKREPLKRIMRSAENEYFMLADAALGEGDLSGARRLYNAAINEGSLIGIVELARSFDPAECNQFGGGQDVEADPERAKALYRQAARYIATLIEELA